MRISLYKATVNDEQMALPVVLGRPVDGLHGGVLTTKRTSMRLAQVMLNQKNNVLVYTVVVGFGGGRDGTKSIRRWDRDHGGVRGSR